MVAEYAVFATAEGRLAGVNVSVTWPERKLIWKTWTPVEPLASVAWAVKLSKAVVPAGGVPVIVPSGFTTIPAAQLVADGIVNV